VRVIFTPHGIHVLKLAALACGSFAAGFAAAIVLMRNNLAYTVAGAMW